MVVTAGMTLTLRPALSTHRTWRVTTNNISKILVQTLVWLLRLSPIHTENWLYTLHVVIYDDISDLQLSKYDYGYYCRRDGQEFAYRFNEYNPNDTQKVYPLFTNRTITASSGHCFSYSQLGDPKPALDTAGDLEALNYTYTNHTYTGSIIIPKQSTGLSGTTYIYRGTRLPQDAVTYACGPRCMWMWVYKAHSKYEEPAFYQCPISISNVENTTNSSAQNIPNDVARIVAASIALQGRWAGTFENQIWTQYQFY